MKLDFFEISKKKEDVEHHWENFLKNSTYLIFDKKQQFLENLRKSTPRIPWFSFKTKRKFKHIKLDLRRLQYEIENYNQQFVDRRLEKYKSFFDGTDDNLKYPLDENQRIAVVKDEKYNLVVAGAGSGKTSVISSRIAYLTRREDSIDKERILAIAFTRVAAEEMDLVENVLFKF